MKIRTKFYVAEAKLDGSIERVQLHAVCGGSDENKSFSQSTPCASLAISIDNPAAHGFFKEGQEYFADFSEAKPEVAPVSEPTAG